jgi:hypothetical protein
MSFNLAEWPIRMIVSGVREAVATPERFDWAIFE